MMESINVRVDDYPPRIDPFRIEDPSMGSIHEERNAFNIPKDALPLSDKESDLISTYVRIIPKLEHLVTEEVRTIEDTQQHQDDQNTNEQTNILAREPSRKVRKNHPTSNIIRDPEANVSTRGVHKVNCREMMGLNLGCYTSTIDPNIYKETPPQLSQRITRKL